MSVNEGVLETGGIVMAERTVSVWCFSCSLEVMCNLRMKLRREMQSSLEHEIGSWLFVCNVPSLYVVEYHLWLTSSPRPDGRTL